MFRLIRKIISLAFMIVILFICVDYVYMDYGFSKTECTNHKCGIIHNYFDKEIVLFDRNW